jgi:hypothetical protein
MFEVPNKLSRMERKNIVPGVSTSLQWGSRFLTAVGKGGYIGNLFYPYPWSKLPAFQFYPGDWMEDPKVSMLSPASRGVWFDLICAMHEAGRLGMLRGTTEQFARIARCSTAEFVQALTDFQTTEVADVTERNGVYQICNRRMSREHKEREGRTLRQSKYRSNAKSNSKVTPFSSSSISSSVTKDTNTSVGGGGERDFLTNVAWKEQFCMSKRITMGVMEGIQKQFLEDVKLRGENPVNLKSYFTNWFNKHQDRLLKSGEMSKVRQLRNSTTRR